MALVKYNNNSISAVTSAASIPSADMVHIKTLTASSSATLSFVDGADSVVLDSTYPIYVFKFINMHPATDDQSFSFQGSTNSGSSYGVTLTSTVFTALHLENDSTTSLGYQTGYDLAQSTSFQRFGQTVGNDNDQSCSGEMFLFSPSSTTFVKHFMSRMAHNGYTDYAGDGYMGGYFNSTSAINAIQFKFASGNTDSGKIKLYGIKDS
jgi:hypothetical protein